MGTRVPPFDQLLGPLGLTVGAVFVVGYLGRAGYQWVTALWSEHLRVDRERAEALIKSNERVDALRESNDANMRIIERAVAQNERLVAALARSGATGGGSNEG